MADSPRKKPKNSALAEAMQRGRQLRSAQPEGQPLFISEGLSFADLENQPKGVGLVYDKEMLEPKCGWDKKQIECPQRLSSVYEKCRQYGLVKRCVELEPRKATKDEILLCHTKEYYDVVKSSETMHSDELKELSTKYDGIYFHTKTFSSALLAAGCSLEALDAVHSGRVRHAMALVRPPGHHSMKDQANGYCFFNNVAIAAKHAVENLGYKRVLILDWDVHHGQGIQYMFYDDPRVMYFSIHRYEHGTYWPNLRESDCDAVGEGVGRGFNVNVPLSHTGMNNADYLAIFTQILLPIANQFQPDLILVSAGYDAALGCPEGEMNVTPAMFSHLTNLLKPLANGKLCFILEGGYCIKSLAESAALTLRALLGDPCPLMGPLEPPSESIKFTILKTLQAQREFWPCLKYQGQCPDDEEPEVFSKFKPPENIKFSTPENIPDKHLIYGDYIVHPPEKSKALDQQINTLTRNTNLTVPSNRTCLVYDERMLKHRATSMPGHPERPDRIKRIFEKHRECGLLNRCKQLEARCAEEAELALVHDSDYIAHIKSFSDLDPKQLMEAEWGLNSIYLSHDVWESATLATGCTLNVVDEVCSGESVNGLAIVRPPGHHAEKDKCCGFCFFDTVAVAAKYAQKHYPVKRVMILDWDVHHGNGVQHAFEDDPSVLYISLHRHDNGFFYPGGDGGDYHQVGKGEGIGYNVNIPWNGITARDTEYLAAFQHVVMPIAYEFCPDLVLVSAGFDAAKGDPLGGMSITPEGYGHMTQLLMGLANGRLILVLEGGYNLISISESMATCTSVMLGDQCPEVVVSYPWPLAVESICNVLDTHQQYWESLQYRADLPGKVAKALTPMERLEMKEEDPEPTMATSAPPETQNVKKLNAEVELDKLFARMTDQLQQLGLFSHFSGSSDEPDDYADFVSKEENKDEVELASGVNTSCQTQGMAGLDGDASQSQESTGDASQSQQGTDVASQSQNTGDARQSQKTTEDANQSEIINDDSHSHNSTGDVSQSQISADVPSQSLKDIGDASPLQQSSEDASQSNSSPGGTSESKSNPTEAVQSEQGAGDADHSVEEPGACGGGLSDLKKALGLQDGQELHAVVPLPWCPHLAEVQDVPLMGLEVHDPCGECANIGENWVCLSCYEVHCSRYVNEHMLMHSIDTGHRVVLSYADLSVWCYACDSYVHNEILVPAKRSAHISKFDEDVPGL